MVSGIDGSLSPMLRRKQEVGERKDANLMMSDEARKYIEAWDAALDPFDLINLIESRLCDQRGRRAVERR